MAIGKWIALATLVVVTPVGTAVAQMPKGSVYVLHSKPHGGRPSLDWYIVAETNNLLAGMIAWNDMKTMTKATGTVDRSRHTFTMAAAEIGGQGRIFKIEGKTEGRRIVADIKGPGIACTAIAVPINHALSNATVQ